MHRWLGLALVFSLVGAATACGDGTQCDPACDADACMVCDSSGDTPVCASACGSGLTCEQGECKAPAQLSCSPACGDCQVCDTSGASPVCADMCSSELVCQNNMCVKPAEATCSPACGACQMCDTSLSTPACVDLCGTGTSCQSGACEPDPAPACSPACSPCQTCDTSTSTPTCVDNCATGTSCVNNACAPVDPCAAAPCGDCQMCDTSGTAPACVSLCASGTSCVSGACEPDPAPVCTPACSACQTCDSAGASPVCVDNCGEGATCAGDVCVPLDPCGGSCVACQVCDDAHGAPLCIDACMSNQYCDVSNEVCRPLGDRPAFDHSTLSELQQSFTADIAGGKQVTALCLGCHAQAGQDVLKTAHWNWQGATPGLAGHTTGTSIGKKNLVNNFCVAIPSNEKRCTQCHVGYGWVDKTFDFTDEGSIDCLVCHSPNYKKDPTTGGGPLDGINDGTTPAVDMALAAQTVGRPTRATCGGCHFSAGGGDSVKKGDIYSALGNPADETVDVHMGNSNYKFVCVDCHVAKNHQITGAGVHLPVSEGRMDCSDCHGEAPHSSAVQNNHARDLACQTCHVPAFARQKPTKMNWDWSTAGNRDRGTNGVETTTVSGQTVTNYDAMKGDFVWVKDVRPEYAWYNGQVERMTLTDSFASGMGTSTTPIHLGGPTATIDDMDAVIYPFKVMRGRQPVDVTNHLVSSPKLFGPGGFWATIPAAGSYDAAVVQTNWTNALTAGARYASQIGPSDTYSHVSAGSGSPQWDWAYTEMWMGINHEVAPSTAALGCTDCHYSAAGWDWTALGYSCDPANPPSGQTAVDCGSRHP